MPTKLTPTACVMSLPPSQWKVPTKLTPTVYVKSLSPSQWKVPTTLPHSCSLILLYSAKSLPVNQGHKSPEIRPVTCQPHSRLVWTDRSDFTVIMLRLPGASLPTTEPTKHTANQSASQSTNHSNNQPAKYTDKHSDSQPPNHSNNQPAKYTANQ